MARGYNTVVNRNENGSGRLRSGRSPAFIQLLKESFAKIREQVVVIN